MLLFTSVSLGANANITLIQLEEFKNSIKQGCIERGFERKDENAVRFCTCMDNILRANLTDTDFEEIANLADSGKSPSQIPAFNVLLPQISACKTDVDE
jgi:hypothetical protein